MSCPTCDHTMHCIGTSDPLVFWCPRCGTIKSKDEEPDVPTLVQRSLDLCEKTEALILGRATGDGRIVEAARSVTTVRESAEVRPPTVLTPTPEEGH